MFIAIINTPGYLPDSTEPPPTFDTAREAWQYLADERRRHEDDAYDEAFYLAHPHQRPAGYSATANTLETLGTGMFSGSDADYENAGLDPLEQTGTVNGSTPGYDGDHDLGVAYTVEEDES